MTVCKGILANLAERPVVLVTPCGPIWALIHLCVGQLTLLFCHIDNHLLISRYSTLVDGNINLALSLSKKNTYFTLA
jgi:hypothetical protein